MIQALKDRFGDRGTKKNPWLVLRKADVWQGLRRSGYIQRFRGGITMQKHIASVSFGKDSLAMLLLLIKKKYPLDEVVFYDTEMEFQAIYNTRDKILPLLKRKGH